LRNVQGSVIDNRYDVVRTLGSGGMGEVYLAHDRTLGRDVALKVLRSQFADDRESAERFKREALSAASLSHPNIVQVYDRGDTEDGSSYITMEYVPGGTLKEKIVEEGAIDPGLAASYGYQVAEALGAAHAKGVVHRDIKPQNVLITASGQAKVADFGIARAASAVSTSQTKTGTIMGTAGYMSPEQALGHPATPKSDLYSLGVVLYEAVTGTLPFTADNPIAVSMKHVNEAPQPPIELNPAIPAGMNAVIMKLLAKNPDDRYANADTLAEDLWRVRRGMAPAILGPGEAETVETPMRPRDQTTRQAAVAPPRRKRSPALLILAALLLLLGLIGMAWALTQGFGTANTVEVPSVEGQPRDRAVATLENAGFQTQVQTRESDEGDAGNVIDQSPPGGGQAREGSTVTLTVGSGAASVQVPDVTQQSFTEASAELQDAGLAVGTTFDVPSDTVADVVLEQSPTAGTEVERGTPVELGLSTGPALTSPSSASSSASATQDPAADPSPAPNAGGGDASAGASASPAADPNPNQGPDRGPGGGGEAPASPPSGEEGEGEDD
jgi:eukaryotic-like serine/threonine-protein kinase